MIPKSQKKREKKKKSSTSASEDDDLNCDPATVTPSKNTHLYADTTLASSTPISRIAFSSCIKPELQETPTMWKHMRHIFQPDLWIWLGDNAYSDGLDMNFKRSKYNAVRDDPFYKKYGPIASPKIPILGIWDDHDFGTNDIGGRYECKRETQREFCVHLGIDESDVRHPDHNVVEKRQEGTYSSAMFPTPPSLYSSSSPIGGVHVVNLDVRYHRDLLVVGDSSSRERRCPETYSGNKQHTDLLGTRQWSWLEEELLTRKSEIKIISSSIQVLPPTSFNYDIDRYCAYDGTSGTFWDAIHQLDEDHSLETGMGRESWSYAPQARLNLLRMAQRSISTGMAKKVIFLSGNVHWGDMQAKRMPSSQEGGDSQVLWEVTASGIGRTPRDDPYPNYNRVRLRTCDTKGDGIFFNECKFPFRWEGKMYHSCTTDSVEDKRDGIRPWCYYKTDWRRDHKRSSNKWGYCLEEQEELVARRDQLVTTNTCGDNYHQVCGITDIYGGIVVDWVEGNINMTVFTPNEKSIHGGIASSVNISFMPEWKTEQSEVQ